MCAFFVQDLPLAGIPCRTIVQPRVEQVLSLDAARALGIQVEGTGTRWARTVRAEMEARGWMPVFIRFEGALRRGYQRVVMS